MDAKAWSDLVARLDAMETLLELVVADSIDHADEPDAVAEEFEAKVMRIATSSYAGAPEQEAAYRTHLSALSKKIAKRALEQDPAAGGSSGA